MQSVAPTMGHNKDRADDIAKGRVWPLRGPAPIFISPNL